MFSANEYINSLKAGNFIFSDYPRKKSIDDYEEVYEKIRGICARNPGVLSVYTFGQVSVPGISDIDLIFVINDHAKLPRFLRKLAIDRKSKYVLLHPFFIVPKDFMENIGYIHPNSDFQLIYGKKLAIKRLSRPEISTIYNCLINDVILRHYPSDYLKVLLSGKIGIRLSLVRLNALHHSFSLFRTVSGANKKEWQKFADDVENLRKEWFALEMTVAKARLLELLKDSVYISLDFVSEYRKFLEKMEKPVGDMMFKGIQNRISFVEKWDVRDSLSEMIRHYRKHRNFYSILPSVLARQLYAYCAARGPLSRYITERLDKIIQMKKFEDAVMKRVRYSNYQAEYAMQMKHSHFPCFFPLGFKNTKGLKNKMIYTYVLITDHSLFRKAIGLLRSNFNFVF
ncbi:hypothetical protein HYU10_00760 [Candidatus Woesearchaeota archaeon]|nr:hypothetical protein [Candidatus Woesearchaeota archaeon]